MIPYSLPGHYAVFEKPYSLSIITLTLIGIEVKGSEKTSLLLNYFNLY